MRVSLNITHYGSGAPLDHLAAAADDSALTAVWVADHLLQSEPGSDPAAPMQEALTTLGYLAARTTRVGLGTMVAAVTFRPAALLVKAVTTLDVLSGGRARLGLGTGHDGREAAAMGLPFPSVAERYEHLEDVLLLARRMADGDDSPFIGHHVRAGRPVNSPRPARRLPVLIGGHGERRTLPLVARYGDACNLFDIPDGGATVRRKLDVLARACDEVGRPYAEVEKTISTRLLPDESPDAFARRCAALESLGIEHAVVINPGPWAAGDVARLAAAAERLAA